MTQPVDRERRIPVSAPDLTGNEEQYVVDAIRSSWISSTGVYVDRFEREFAEACGTRSAIAVANGTIALHLALLALGVRPGTRSWFPRSRTWPRPTPCVMSAGSPCSWMSIRRPGASTLRSWKMRSRGGREASSPSISTATRRTWTPSIAWLASMAFGSWRTRLRLTSPPTKEAGRRARRHRDLLVLRQQAHHVGRGRCRDACLILGSSCAPERCAVRAWTLPAVTTFQ